MSHNFPQQNNANPFQQPPQPQKSNNAVLLAIIGLLVAIIVVGGLVFFTQSDSDDSNTAAETTEQTTEPATEATTEPSDTAKANTPFHIGSCLSSSFGQSSSLIRNDDVIDCSSPDAKYELTDKTTESNPVSCLRVPGAINILQDFTNPGGEKTAYCIVDKSINPATSINRAKVNDCIAAEGLSSSVLELVDCDDSQAVRISTIVEEPMPGMERGKTGLQKVTEETAMDFCRANGTPDPVGYYSLDFTFTKKDARTWCFSL